MVRLIGIVGAAGSGKSTVAQYLQTHHGAKRIRLADGLKRMLRCIGLTDEQVDGREKLQPVALLCDHTPRHAMQTLGTEWGRRLIGKDIWVNIAVMSVTREWMDNPEQLVVIDDVRHANEVRAIRELGGEIWVVRNPRVEPSFDWRARLRRLFRLDPPVHSSEVEWRTIKADRMIPNIGTVANLHATVAAALTKANGVNDGSST